MKGKFFGLVAAIGIFLTVGATNAEAKTIKDTKGRKIESREMHHRSTIKAVPHGKHMHHKRTMHARKPAINMRDHRSIERYHKQEIRKHKKALKRSQTMRRMQTHYGR
jgi:hypothetical protein